MKNEQILAELRDRGYTINVKIIDDSKCVTLNSTTAVESYQLPRRYSVEDYTDYEVQLDCVSDMLSWSGLRVIETLDYR